MQLLNQLHVPNSYSRVKLQGKDKCTSTLLKLRPVESFSLGLSSCSWASRMSTSCSMSLMVELMSPGKMGPLVCLASSLARLAAFSPLRI